MVATVGEADETRGGEEKRTPPRFSQIGISPFEKFRTVGSARTRLTDALRRSPWFALAALGAAHRPRAIVFGPSRLEPDSATARPLATADEARFAPTGSRGVSERATSSFFKRRARVILPSPWLRTRRRSRRPRAPPRPPPGAPARAARSRSFAARAVSYTHLTLPTILLV